MLAQRCYPCDLAIVYADRYALYVLNGIVCAFDVIEKPGPITFSWSMHTCMRAHILYLYAILWMAYVVKFNHHFTRSLR